MSINVTHQITLHAVWHSITHSLILHDRQSPSFKIIENFFPYVVVCRLFLNSQFFKYQSVGKSIWLQCYTAGEDERELGCLLAALACHRVWPNAACSYEGTKVSKAF